MTDEKTRIGLLKYNDNAHIVFHLNEHQTQSAFSKSVMAVPYEPGRTNMAAALRTMRTDMFERIHGDRPGVPNIGVLIADGYSSIDMHDTTVQARRAREKGIQLFTLGIGIEDFDELKLIANNDKRVFSADGFDALTDLAQSMADAICKGKSLNFAIYHIAPMLDIETNVLVKDYNYRSEGSLYFGHSRPVF